MTRRRDIMNESDRNDQILWIINADIKTVGKAITKTHKDWRFDKDKNGMVYETRWLAEEMDFIRLKRIDDMTSVLIRVYDEEGKRIVDEDTIFSIRYNLLKHTKTPSMKRRQGNQ